jgi:hypothetical protein
VSVALTQQELYCQWFTPPTVAEEFLAWCRIRPDDVLLEPAAGEGALVPEGHRQVVAFEVDPDRCAELRERRPLANVVCADFLAQPPPAAHVADVAVLNPPYSDDGEGTFVLRSLLWAPRACALVRLEALHGSNRHKSCWQHVQLTRIAFLVHRPRFLGLFGARTPHHPKYSYVAVEARCSDGADFSYPETSWVQWR